MEQMSGFSKQQSSQQPLQFQIDPSKNQDIGLSTTLYEVVIKRFQEKLLIVITDGKKFGNVVSASFQRLDENPMDDMIADDDFNQDLDQDIQDGTGEVEDYKIEFNGSLLLGDKTQQRWLELFGQNLLKSLIAVPQFKDIVNILTTISISSDFKKLDPKKQFLFSKTLIEEITQNCK